MNYASVTVVGAGAIGGVCAALLSRAGKDVTLVCKHPETAELAAGRGLHLTGVRGEHLAPVRAVTRIEELPPGQELVLLAVKAPDMLEAARQLAPLLAPEAAVVSLQNGICEEALAKVLGAERVIGCVVGWGATLHGPAEVEMASNGEFVLGRIDGREDQRLGPIAGLLSAVVTTRTSEDILGELYSKLIINSCITSLGAVCGLRLGQMLARRDARRMFLAIMREALSVAEAMELIVPPGGGGRLDYYRLLDGDGLLDDLRRNLLLRLVGLKYRRLKSSMLQSLERGRPSEIDYLSGYIVHKGRELHVPTPVNAMVVSMVKRIEAGEASIEPGNLARLAAGI